MIALFAGPRPALAQDVAVGGVVLAERSLQPVAGALVVTDDSTRRATTDANGRFRLVVPASESVALHVRRLGFRPLRRTVRVGADDLRLVLSEIAVELGVSVGGFTISRAGAAYPDRGNGPR